MQTLLFSTYFLLLGTAICLVFRFNKINKLQIIIDNQKRQELLKCRLRLEQIVKEKTKDLEQANQELLALNEELDTSNEELSAANEELNLINEELEKANLSLNNEIIGHEQTQAERENYRLQLEMLLKQKTEHLVQLTERFAEIYNNTSDAIIFLDVIFTDLLVLKVFGMNKVAQKLFSVNAAQIENGVYASDFISKANYEAFLEINVPSILAGNTITINEDTELSNGYWLSTLIPIKDENGKVYRIAVFSKDITAEHERAEASAMLQFAIDSWPFEFWARDIKGRQILQNKISRNKVGNMIGKRLEDFDMPDNAKSQALSIMHRVLSGESLSLDFETSVSGQKRFVVYKLNPIIYNNKINGYTSLVVDITQQKLAEMALRESEKRLSQLLESVTDYKFTVKLINGKIVNSLHSEGCLSVTGYSPLELRDNTSLWFKLAHCDDKQLLKEWLDKVGQGIEVEPFDHRIIRKNGETIWVSNTTVLKKDSQGMLIGFDGLVSDITKRKNAEAALRESEEKYRLLANNVNDVIWKLDINTLRYTYFSPSIFKLAGYTVVEALALTLDQILMPDSLHDLMQILPAWITQYKNEDVGSKHRIFEYQIIQKNRQPLWVEINATLYIDTAGGIKEVIATSRIIEERKASELALRTSEERYELVTKLSEYVVYDYDIVNGNIIWTGAVEKVLGYTISELNDKSVEELMKFFHPDDFNSMMKKYDTERNMILPSINNYRYLTKNKGYIWIEANAFLFTDDQNKQYRWLGIMKDITNQLQIQSLIKESEEQLKTIFNTTKDGIVVLNKEMEIFEINNSALKRSGYSHEELVGKSILGFLIKNEPSEIVQHILSIWDKDVIDNFETDILIKNDGSFPVEISATAINIDNQEMLLLMIRDISERKHHEKQLLHSVIDTEEKERIHFSQDLHDGLGPLLSAAKMYTEWLAEPEPDVDPKVIIADIKKLLEESTRTVKDISFKLSPHILQNYGLIEALNAYSEKVKKPGKTRIIINAENINRFEKIVETIVYRVTCECINNAIKHAKAANIIVSLNFTENILKIDILDDGRGFDVNTVSKSHKGIGLLNIQNRLKSINGQFLLQSVTGDGTRIAINVPLNA